MKTFNRVAEFFLTPFLKLGNIPLVWGYYFGYIFHDRLKFIFGVFIRQDIKQLVMRGDVCLVFCHICESRIKRMPLESSELFWYRFYCPDTMALKFVSFSSIRQFCDFFIKKPAVNPFPLNDSGIVILFNYLWPLFNRRPTRVLGARKRLYF